MLLSESIASGLKGPLIAFLLHGRGALSDDATLANFGRNLMSSSKPGYKSRKLHEAQKALSMERLCWALPHDRRSP